MIRTLTARLLFAGEVVLLTALVVVSIQSFAVQPYRVERESMLDTLQDGEMVLVDKLLPRIVGIARGDIIVFQPPPREGDDGTPFIKRVIGLPGDRVELRDGRVVINGVPIDESAYVYRREPTLPTDTIVAWEVPPDRLFVLGDHRVDSTDSRVAWLGTVPVERVVGRAAFRYWPLDAAAVLDTPDYPELRAPTADGSAQPGPVTQVSMPRE